MPVARPVLVRPHALWQVIEKRRLNASSLAVICVETLAGRAIRELLFFHAFLDMLRFRDNDFLLPSRFTGSVQISLLSLPFRLSFNGIAGNRKNHRGDDQ